jgi:ABC-type sugar transport system permease subunit
MSVASTQIATRPAAPPWKARLWAMQVKAAPYLFVSPFVVLFLVFLAYPLVRSLVISVQQTVGHETRWVGARNYSFLVRDPLMWISALNTVGYAIAILAVQIPASLGLAVLLNGKRVKCREAFRFAFFAPFLVGQVFVALIFGLMLSNKGPVNEAIRMLPGLANLEILWLADPVRARLAIVIASLWLGVGFGMIYFLAALQSVDRELYEAADIDGAGKWQQFLNVTLPGIRPVLAFLILSGTIGGLQMIELPYELVGGPGPGGAGLTIVSYLFTWIESGDLNTAAAVGWLLAVAVIGIAIFQARKMRGAFED